MVDQNRIGIRFQFAQTYTDHLAKLFQNIFVEHYTWYVSYSENLFSHNGKVEMFLPDGVYTGEQLKNIINNADYYLILFCLYGVPSGKYFAQEDIKHYQDYLQSNAEIALFCADGFADLYAKDPIILENIMTSCQEYKETFLSEEEFPLGFFTEENDERTGFYI